MEDGTIVNDCNFNYVFNNPGVNIVEQIITNEAGCTDHAIGYVIVDGYTFYAPNTFTPDGDFINDWWKPIVSGASDYHLQVFNRWGDLIFETTDPEMAWIGDVRGGDHFAEDGVYNYRCILHDLSGYPHDFRGHINLLR
jgi:gliding motility-associated-like protein